MKIYFKDTFSCTLFIRSFSVCALAHLCLHTFVNNNKFNRYLLNNCVFHLKLIQFTSLVRATFFVRLHSTLSDIYFRCGERAPFAVAGDCNYIVSFVWKFIVSMQREKCEDLKGFRRRRNIRLRCSTGWVLHEDTYDEWRFAQRE